MFLFLKTDIRGQKNYEKRMHTSVDNTANGLRYEIMFQNRVNKKNNLLSFLKQKYILFMETYFFKIPRYLVAPAFPFFFFFGGGGGGGVGEADTKKQRYASPKAPNAT